MTLTEFLLARLREEEDAEVLAIAPELPEPVREGLLAAQATRLSRRLRAAGYAMSPAFICRSAAQRFADHPDFDEAWRA